MDLVSFRLIAFFTICLFSFTEVNGQADFRTVANNAFKPGETLDYRIHYGLVDAGEARLHIKPTIYQVNNRPTFHVVGTGRTLGAFDWFFKVRDRYESYIDTMALIPWIFVRRIDEGGYVKNQDVSFDHHNRTAKSNTATIPVPENVQDLVSAFYYARNLDFTNAKPGQSFPFKAYLDDEVFSMTIKYLGKETLKTKLGTFNCIKFRPMLLQGRVFKEEEDMTVWVSDDANRIVVRAQAEILVGSIKMDLKGYSGLANPLSSKKK
ncbi:MAG: DUF3108 domain-containing protein [Bacteroidota bacterium]|jgi:hypothetical protein